MPAEAAKVAETAAKTASDTVKTASEKVKATTEQYTAAGASAFKGGIEKSLAGLNEINAQSKRNLEAVVASATAAAKGAETLGTQTMAFSKSAVERHVEATKALTGARSFQEAVELQTSYAKSAMETYLAEMTRASETFSATLKDTLRPLNERAAAVVETLQVAR